MMGLSDILSWVKRESLTPLSPLATLTAPFPGTNVLGSALPWAGLLGTLGVVSGIGGGKFVAGKLLGGPKPSGGLSSKIGQASVPAAPGPVASQLGRPFARHGAKTVKQAFAETAVKEAFKAGKASVKARAKRARSERAQPGARRRSSTRRLSSTPAPRATRVRRRSTRPPSAKQLAARARFKRLYGGRRR